MELPEEAEAAAAALCKCAANSGDCTLLGAAELFPVGGNGLDLADGVEESRHGGHLKCRRVPFVGIQRKARRRRRKSTRTS